ncbi:MAG: hypothetical protein ACYTG0_12550 [Planctomycetota bacterium]|jgi:hypothetical protein
MKPNHQVDLALEGLVGARVRVEEHPAKSGPCRGLILPGFRGDTVRLLWRHNQWYFELRDVQGRRRYAPALAIPVARRIIMNGGAK